MDKVIIKNLLARGSVIATVMAAMVTLLAAAKRPRRPLM
jgi:hypothetical protein